MYYSIIPYNIIVLQEVSAGWHLLEASVPGKTYPIYRIEVTQLVPAPFLHLPPPLLPPSHHRPLLGARACFSR
jgi:hypothetical protein